ncbi:cystathionine beta-synthase [Drepanopeziza brunnea f. sp. 'multigermtubi' MB_m1]|uniref:Cystathionine beta-synthase n=1 Tax=Marssonina brunnea f. sp. multigermtubi (strain MB_m1) TaxID=1072389 RepID=K1W754_MARBU|nr:cystathionine beta-synthase [Drepanopeziza brunnea f. sp. 'multigermtubi' MB_m1]EKD12885.1 cystathionine beta-synthase [Drepanopeziza brunnea f. sp. 'multigermtubi' MB_m1]
MSTKHTSPAVPRAKVMSATELIGNTPLVRLNKIPQSLGIEAEVYVKVEFVNAGGSVKDRIALRMIEQAEQSGRIKPGDTLIEPTSGNTGIGLALVGAIKGYKTIITLPEKMSSEKVAVLRALGATIIRTPTQAAFDSPESHIGVARRLLNEIPNSHILDQYTNKDNPLAHEHGTAEEIWSQSEGKITAIVAGRRNWRNHYWPVEGIEEGVKELGLGKGDTVVVVLPDSIRSYLSKFADDDWLAANDLLPPSPPTTSPPSPVLESSSAKKDPYHGATIESLRLKPVTTVLANTPCSEAVETMREKGFDQLPVLAPTGGKLVGLVTLGNLLSWISRGRATGKSPVSDVMFDFSSIPEVVTDPKDISHLSQAPKTNGLEESDNGKKQKTPKRKFVQITMDTPLSALSKFFEWNSSAVVTEKVGGMQGGLSKPVAVVTKVDLLSWMVKQHSI